VIVIHTRITGIIFTLPATTLGSSVKARKADTSHGWGAAGLTDNLYDSSWLPKADAKSGFRHTAISITNAQSFVSRITGRAFSASAHWHAHNVKGKNALPANIADEFIAEQAGVWTGSTSIGILGSIARILSKRSPREEDPD
jgi:hypothetical protein